MKSLLLAIQFLTIFPVKVKEAGEEQMAGSVIYFPLVGLILGLFLAGINDLLLLYGFNIISINIITVVALIIITGGMHLDGLSDTADAFLSGEPKEEMFRIMRDPRTGVMGTLSLICIILLKISLLYSLDVSIRTNALLLMCVLSRWSAVLTMFLFPYARQDGKAGVFIRGMNLKIFILCAITAIACVILIWRIKGLIVWLIVSICAYLFGKIIKGRINGITGDTLGATIELMEIASLTVVYMVR